jgi:hypothetical protein
MFSLAGVDLLRTVGDLSLETEPSQILRVRPLTKVITLFVSETFTKPAFISAALKFLD